MHDGSDRQIGRELRRVVVPEPESIPRPDERRETAPAEPERVAPAEPAREPEKVPAGSAEERARRRYWDAVRGANA